MRVTLSARFCNPGSVYTLRGRKERAAKEARTSRIVVQNSGRPSTLVNSASTTRERRGSVSLYQPILTLTIRLSTNPPRTGSGPLGLARTCNFGFTVGRRAGNRGLLRPWEQLSTNLAGLAFGAEMQAATSVACGVVDVDERLRLLGICNHCGRGTPAPSVMPSVLEPGVVMYPQIGCIAQAVRSHLNETGGCRARDLVIEWVPNGATVRSTRATSRRVELLQRMATLALNHSLLKRLLDVLDDFGISPRTLLG
ncbi:hypothetical protein C8R43DRAFT_951336 [Mycena crocata]|nr:hypothetical protein C8R43DRAFT_952196 [Mycena crocata]KAJ7150908.1 hypothetical protein C8R43DRAFT_951336 [Mycena crocata]